MYRCCLLCPPSSPPSPPRSAASAAASGWPCTAPRFASGPNMSEFLTVKGQPSTCVCCSPGATSSTSSMSRSPTSSAPRAFARPPAAERSISSADRKAPTGGADGGSMSVSVDDDDEAPSMSRCPLLAAVDAAEGAMASRLAVPVSALACASSGASSRLSPGLPAGPSSILTCPSGSLSTIRLVISTSLSRFSRASMARCVVLSAEVYAHAKRSLRCALFLARISANEALSSDVYCCWNASSESVPSYLVDGGSATDAAERRAPPRIDDSGVCASGVSPPASEPYGVSPGSVRLQFSPLACLNDAGRVSDHDAPALTFLRFLGLGVGVTSARTLATCSAITVASLLSDSTRARSRFASSSCKAGKKSRLMMSDTACVYSSSCTSRSRRG